MRTKQHETQTLRKPGTGDWLLNGATFIEWQDHPGSLWIQGNCKRISVCHGQNSKPKRSWYREERPEVHRLIFLTSTCSNHKLVEDKRLFNGVRNSCAVAFFYFDFKDKDPHPVERALRRLILQLSAQSSNTYEALDHHYKVSDGQILPSRHQLVQVLEELLSGIGRSYIILGALDECQSSLVSSQY
ncbi:hypothetical protein B0H14DRAFT_2587584 [Mycena olivaceomarginata]|nr:hypothetical protein B0H14DRAFT_2587584 [Mycena olivaceomarginata]